MKNDDEFEFQGKPVVSYRLSIIAFAGALVMLILIVAGIRCNAQSIGVDFQMHSNGVHQYGITTTKTIGNFGGYFDRISHEDVNEDYVLQYTVTTICGYSVGINYSTNGERFDNISLGCGEYKIHSFNTKDGEMTKTFFVEIKTGLKITNWLNLVIGVSSYPAILSGVHLKVNF